MKYTARDHTFAVCAYKESPYLEECILSILSQDVQSNVLIVTSTPNEHIKKLAEQYKIPYYVREGKSEISADWNFAYEQAQTKLVTITHQDDIYCKNYLKSMLYHINLANSPIIAFGDYGEIRGNETVYNNHLLKIKRIMLSPLRNRFLWQSCFVRRRILAFGSAICCPSVTFVKDNISGYIFEEKYSSDLDWQAWEMLSRKKGSFVYCNEVVMLHRIHEESATTKIIGDSRRTKEDYDMYCKFWPKWIAKILILFYKRSQNSNKV